MVVAVGFMAGFSYSCVPDGGPAFAGDSGCGCTQLGALAAHELIIINSIAFANLTMFASPVYVDHLLRRLPTGNPINTRGGSVPKIV